MVEKQITDIELTSGFTVAVSSLPPYYRDMIDAKYPLPKYPQREITLASGDVVDWPYEPPDEAPQDDDEDYDLFIKWHDVHRKIKELTEERNVARVNYLLNMCVEIIDGPIEFEDVDSWVYKIENAIDGFKVPENAGQRLLLFLKHFVLTTNQELNIVVTACTTMEVTMPGISSALRGFPDSLEEGGSRRDTDEEV